MNCLNCDKVFKQKRPTAKFCSDNCRVKYHRKHGKKDIIKPFQMQSLYNEIKDMLGKINYQEANDGAKTKITYNERPMFSTPVNPTYFNPADLPVLMEKYFERKRECQDATDWKSLSDEIDNDTRLNKQARIILKTTNQ